jgi:hypothetical protein
VRDEGEAQAVRAEPLRHVAAVDETQFQKAAAPVPLHGEGASVETTDDPAPDVEDDDHP